MLRFVIIHKFGKPISIKRELFKKFKQKFGELNHLSNQKLNQPRNCK